VEGESAANAEVARVVSISAMVAGGRVVYGVEGIAVSQSVQYEFEKRLSHICEYDAGARGRFRDLTRASTTNAASHPLRRQPQAAN